VVPTKHGNRFSVNPFPVINEGLPEAPRHRPLRIKEKKEAICDIQTNLPENGEAAGKAMSTRLQHLEK
jgi:hypothetical protein